MKKRSILLSAVMVILVSGILLTGKHYVSGQDRPQQNNDAPVIMRTVEVSGMMPSTLVIVYADGTVERGEMAKINTKNLEMNLVTVHTRIREIIAKGYELTTVAGGNSDGSICTTYIFRKKG